MNSDRSLATVFAALKSQRVVAAFIIVIGIVAAGLAVWFIPAKYTATSTVLMVAEPPEAQSNVPTAAAKPLLSADLPSLATSATVLARFKHDLGSMEGLDTLRSRIRAKVSLDSNIMPVQYMGKTEAAAITGANALTDEISRAYREIATTRFDSLIQDLNGQISSRRSQLMLLDRRLQVAAQDYPFIDVESARSGGGTNSGSVYERMIALRAERDELQATVQSDAAIAASSAGFVKDAMPLAMRDVIENDAVYRNLHDQYAKDSAQLGHLEAFATDSYPGLVDLRNIVARESAQVADARQRAERSGPRANSAYAQALDVQAKSEGQLAGDHAKLDAIEGELNALNTDMRQGGVATTVALIRRDRENVEFSYSTLSERLAKAVADRAEASSTGSVIVMDRAQYAQRATWTSGDVIGSAILVFSVWLAITLCVMLEGSRQRRRDPASVETIYGAPVLGAVA